MQKKQTIITNRSGLHARPASDFVIKAKEFDSNITIRNMDTGNPSVNAKSILKLLGEGMCNGTRVELCADGPDEQSAIDALVVMIESGFGDSVEQYDL